MTALGSSNPYGDECNERGVEAPRVPVECLSLSDLRRLYAATPGRNPTGGEICRFSEEIAARRNATGPKR